MLAGNNNVGCSSGVGHVQPVHELRGFRSCGRLSCFVTFFHVIDLDSSEASAIDAPLAYLTA